MPKQLPLDVHRGKDVRAGAALPDAPPGHAQHLVQASQRRQRLDGGVLDEGALGGVLPQAQGARAGPVGGGVVEEVA